jgi:hypothetical protein
MIQLPIDSIFWTKCASSVSKEKNSVNDLNNTLIAAPAIDLYELLGILIARGEVHNWVA